MFESASTNMVHHHATTLVSELHFYRRVNPSLRIFYMEPTDYGFCSENTNGADQSSLFVTVLVES